MRFNIGKLVIEGDASSLGFDFSMSLPFTHPIHEYTLDKQFFAIWWCKRCDCGVMLCNREVRFSLGRRTNV